MKTTSGFHYQKMESGVALLLLMSTVRDKNRIRGEKIYFCFSFIPTGLCLPTGRILITHVMDKMMSVKVIKTIAESVQITG